ncbi:unnamed protein product [Meloidogyne enterolobii]|uniref:Uncharacterized protein n=1 Tax=Meloidogyne enterolobii TaxID=390850 RepID=A0ACB0YEX9_MELEN
MDRQVKESKSHSLSATSFSSLSSPSFTYFPYQHSESNNNNDHIPPPILLPSKFNKNNFLSSSNSSTTHIPSIVFDRHSAEALVGSVDSFGNENSRDTSSGTTVDIVDRAPFYVGAGGRLPIGEQKMSSLEKLIRLVYKIILKNIMYPMMLLNNFHINGGLNKRNKVKNLKIG